ncbi:MAG: PVC-type heme-binding CxxCH protein, partial [Planctomycetota bacterium]
MRLSISLAAVVLLVTYVFLPVSGQEKPVIPHAQSKPPGPALSPQDAIKAMTVPPGFTVELVASEPDLINPVAMHIDEKGRFWVTESLEYPRRSAGPGQDRVKVIEIGDDGKAKKVTTVIEGLNIPSGIAVGHGGVWLVNAPDLLYYPIEDFDNLKLGKPQVVVSGFGRADTHELPNSLTWGPDGYLYGLNGVFNPSSIKQDGKTWNFTAAMFRIHPGTKKFDLFCEGTSNPWGIAFNDNGDAFISACVIDHLWHLTQTGYYHRQGGPYPPFTWKIESIVKHKHQARAYCGITWFDSDAYPEEYRKKLYMGNIHGGCINVDAIEKDGSTYAGKPAFVGEHKKLGVGEGNDFLVANDAWFMPVVQKVGPDGCLYILDWYDRYHCYQDANRDPKGIDRLKGRLYRVRYKDTPRAEKFNLGAEDNVELIKKLDSGNIFIRETCQRILSERIDREGWNSGKQAERLVEKGIKNPVAMLWDIVKSKTTSNRFQNHALWTLIGSGAFEREFIIKALNLRTDPIYRAWAVRARASKTFSYNRETSIGSYLAEFVSDSSPDVLVQVAIASRKAEDPIPVLISVLNNCGNDKLIPHIVWQNLHPLLEDRSDAFLKEVAKLDPEKAPNVYNLMPRVVDRILGAKKQDPQALASLVTTLSASPSSRESAAKVLALLNTKVQTGELAGENLKALEGRLLPAVRKMQNGSNLALAMEATLLGAAFKDEESLQSVRDLFKSSKQPEAIRLKALDSLIAANDHGVLTTVKSVLDDPKSATLAFRGTMHSSLGKLDDPKVANLVLGAYKQMEPDLQPRALELLTQRANWS